jgi:hypothetical protein
MKRFIWLLVLLVLAVVFVPTSAPARHEASPEVRAYVEGFCHKPRRGVVLLSYVAILRRFTDWDEPSSEVATRVTLWGDRAGGPVEFRVLDSLYKSWERDRDVGQDPQWVSNAFSWEFGPRKAVNFDALRLDAGVYFGDSIVRPQPRHLYNALAQWDADMGCSERHAGTVELP